MNGRLPRWIAVLAWLLTVSAPGLAVEPDEVLDDPVLEARARALSQELRCLVCQNESIDSSNADLARDLRILVRERLVAGDSDAEVKAYLVARYGDFVLLDPPFRPRTYVLWFGPLAVLLIGIGGLVLYFRRRAATSGPGAAPLTVEEEARLRRLVDEPAPRP